LLGHQNLPDCKMKHPIVFLLLILPLRLFSQTGGTVSDKKTGAPIPYANIWVENQNIGTTSDLAGKFNFKEDILGKTLIMTAIGYENLNLIIKTNNLKIELTPRTYELEEIVALPKKEIELVVDKFHVLTLITHKFSCEGKPWMVAKYFEYANSYQQTPYLKKLRLLTECETETAIFNLRLMYANEKGEPSNDILKKNLIVTAVKGTRRATVDLSDYHIPIPREGFFVAVEWLVIESNRSEFNYTKKGSNKKLTKIRYNPSFRAVENNNGVWIYQNGKTWVQLKKILLKTESTLTDLAIELTLSN
jgi:hypothetical protein